MPRRKGRSPAAREAEHNSHTPSTPPADAEAESPRPTLEVVPPSAPLRKEIEARQQAEEKLRASEERLRLTLDGAQMGTWHWDLRTQELEWSAQALALFGLPSGTKMTFHRFLESLAPETRSSVESSVRRALAERSDYDVELDVIWPDGTRHWVASKGRGYYDSQGQPTRMEGVAFDVTARKAAEQAAAEREAYLQRAQAIARIGSWSIDLGTGAHAGSPEMYRILGIPNDSIPTITLERYLEFVVPEDRHRVAKAWKEAMTGKSYRVEYRIETQEGRKWLSSLAHVQFRDGQPIRVVGTAQDITELKQTEESLARERLLTEAFLDSVPGLLYVYDDQWRLVRWNERHEELTGYSGEELRNRDILTWAEEDERDRLRQTVERAFVTGQAHSEINLVVKDGSRVPFFYTLHKVELDGKPHITGIAVDVSALKAAQREIVERTEELDRFFRLAPVILSIADATGEFRRVNLAWETMLGYRIDEVVGRNFTDLVHPEDIERTRTALAQVMAGQTLSGFTNRFRHKNGGYRWFEWNAASSGDLACGLARDITESKHAQEALQRSEEQLRAFVQNAPFGITRATISGDRFLNVNPALVRMLGYDSEEEILRLELSRDIYPEPADRQRFLAQLPRQGRFRGVEIRWKRRDGSLITVRTSGLSLPDERGNYDILESIVEDITEHRLLQEQFRQAQKLEAIGRLAGGVAHDFNNMLGVILGYCEIIAMEVGPEAPVHARLDVIRKTCERAASLTSQLLAFSRRRVLQPKVVDVNAIVSETERMLRRVIGEDINLNLELASDLGHVKADPAQLVQIVMNLAINARDAMPQGGLLTIGTKNLEISGEMPGCTPVAPGSYVDITVSDTGVGMDRDTQSHIFEPFFTTKPAGKGTGLGLSTVYGIVQQSGGGLCVQSEPGKGSTFRIFLPRFADTLPPALPNSVQSRKEGESRTVLLVEDELALRDALATQLEIAGYRVLRAAEGQEALAAALDHKQRIDLLITDVVMPQMRGQELAAQLQVIHPETRVLYMSGYADDLVLGGVDGLSFVQKPFRFSEVISKVQKLLEPEA